MTYRLTNVTSRAGIERLVGYWPAIDSCPEHFGLVELSAEEAANIERCRFAEVDRDFEKWPRQCPECGEWSAAVQCPRESSAHHEFGPDGEEMPVTEML